MVRKRTTFRRPGQDIHCSVTVYDFKIVPKEYHNGILVATILITKTPQDGIIIIDTLKLLCTLIFHNITHHGVLYVGSLLQIIYLLTVYISLS